MLVDSQSCSNIAIVLVLFVERVPVSLDLSFVAKLAKTQDFFLYTSGAGLYTIEYIYNRVQIPASEVYTTRKTS